MSWGVYDYPSPPEEKTKEVEVKIIVEYYTTAEVPDNWDMQDITNDVKENFRDYISCADYEIVEVE